MNDSQKIVVAMLFGQYDESKTREETLERLKTCVKLASTLNLWVNCGIPDEVAKDD